MPHNKDMRFPKLKFRLRTLLILLTICAIGFGIWGNHLYRQHREQLAIEAIKAAGGRLETKEEKTVRVYISGETWDNEKLKTIIPHLQRLRDLRELDLVKTPINGPSIETLAELKRLPLLYVFETQLTDSDIQRLSAALPRTQVKTTLPDPIASRMGAAIIYPHAMVAVAWSYDGLKFASSSGDGSARLWDFDHQAPIAEWIAHSKWAFAIQFSPDGKVVATGGGDATVRVWDVATQTLLAELEGHRDDVHALAFTPDGTQIISASDDRTIRVWDWRGQTLIRTLSGHTAQIPQLDISPDGRWIASTSRDDTVRIWNVATGEMLAVLEPQLGDMLTVAFDASGKRLAASGVSGAILIWDIGGLEHGTPGHLAQTIPAVDHPVYRLDFNSDSTRLAAAGDKGVSVFDLQNGKSKRTEDQTKVACLAFHPTQNLLATTNAAGELRLLEARTLEPQAIRRTAFGERGLELPGD